MNYIKDEKYLELKDLVFSRLPDIKEKEEINLDLILMALGGDHSVMSNGDLYWEHEHGKDFICKFELGQPAHLQSLETIEKLVEILK